VGTEAVRRWWFVKVEQRVYRRVSRFASRVHGRGPLLVAIGDSLTDPTSEYTFPWQVWLRRVGRTGYKTLNLGVAGDTTGDMRRRIEQTLSHGPPEIAVLFGGANDAFFGVSPAETAQNVTFIVDWLREHGARHIVLMTPGLLNFEQEADSAPAIERVRVVLSEVAQRRGALFVDLVGFFRERIEDGHDPDCSRVPYRRSRSWHVSDRDPHYNAYGQRLVAAAFLTATADWRRPT
jgi:lysophospholipase L1-like esterase